MSEVGKYVVFDDDLPAAAPGVTEAEAAEQADRVVEIEVDPLLMARKILQIVMG